MKIKIKLLALTIVLIFSATLNSVFGQVTGVGLSIAAGDMLGTSNSNDANIVTQQTQNINFFTNGGTTYPWSNQRMTILSTGKVGIGNFTPYFKLDVDAGDININDPTKGYRIGAGSNSPYVLWNNGALANLFVGVGAGNTSIPTSFANTTLVGYKAGYILNGIGSYNNTFIGSSSGSNAYSDGATTYGCSWNTGVGVYALDSTRAYGGCAFGYAAGRSNIYGCSLTAVGELAMYYNSLGNDNCAFGHHAMIGNKSLSDNVAIGSDALANQSFDPPDCSGGGYDHGCVSSWNVAVGNDALFHTGPSSLTGGGILADGMGNTAIGHSASIG